MTLDPASSRDSGGGGGIPAGLLTAKGSMIAASAADTAAEVLVGADGTFLAASAAATEGVDYLLPPGTEVAYAEKTTGTDWAGSLIAIVDSPAYVFPGSKAYEITFYTALLANFNADTTAQILLYLDPAGANTLVGNLGQIATSNYQIPICAKVRVTPAAGSHIYRVALNRFAGSANPHVAGSAGAPAFISIRTV